MQVLNMYDAQDTSLTSEGEDQQHVFPATLPLIKAEKGK